MINKVTLISNKKTKFPDIKNQGNRFTIDCSEIQNTNSFDIEIEFTSSILAFRNHDYTWTDLKNVRIATDFSPKIIKLENGTYVQPNRTDGIWETDAKNHKKLYWKFNPEYSKPLTKYGDLNSKNLVHANSKVKFEIKFELLFSDKYAIEISQSKIPFSAVACFTDHCDFDTLENLKAQRNFFKSNNIKITKGFFLNHFSKREENASWENDKEELQKWRNDGHELCYHSLSQSIKSEEESQRDFLGFEPPFSEIPVWIDHGYQPYNFSLFEKSKITPKDYETILEEKKINILWNYIDSGTATNGVLNQMNAAHFTLNNFLKGNKDTSTMKRVQALIKNIVFHYINDENTIARYKATAQHFKKIVYQKKISILPKFLKEFTILGKEIGAVIFSWKKVKDKPFKVAKYTPLFFNHIIDKGKITVFQTVEMIDFEKSLSKENLNLLIKESGIFIAHTYFSDNISYHNGKLLTEKNEISPVIKNNFDYLGRKITEQKIWNPTLSEFYDYLQQFENAAFEIDSEGTIKMSNSGNLNYRKVQ